MNQLQMALQIRKELRDVLWPSAGSVVFGDNVQVTAGTPTEAQIPVQFPWAMVVMESAEADDDDPDLQICTFRIVSAQNVWGDPQGEMAIIGGARSSLTTSGGAGIGEIDAQVRSALDKMTGADGTKIILQSSGIEGPGLLRGHQVVMSELEVTARCTSQPHYSFPQQLANSAGTWSWEGVHCSDRFDFVQYRLGWIDGATPGNVPADVTVIYTGSTPSFTETPTASRVYSVWADYNLRKPDGASTVEGSSALDEVGAYVAT